MKNTKENKNFDAEHFVRDPENDTTWFEGSVKVNHFKVV